MIHDEIHPVKRGLFVFVFFMGVVTGYIKHHPWFILITLGMMIGSSVFANLSMVGGFGTLVFPYCILILAAQYKRSMLVKSTTFIAIYFLLLVIDLYDTYAAIMQLPH